MKISVKAKPGAFEEKIEKTGHNSFTVAVREPPINGQANRAICRALAEYFGVPLASVRVVSGFTGRNKIFVI